MKYSLIILGVLSLFLTPHASAVSKDVCCFGVRKTGDGKYQPFAGPKSQKECKPGTSGFRDGQRVCGSTNDLDNCANMGRDMADMCGRCGLNWIAALGTCSDKTLEELTPKKEDDKNPKAKDGKDPRATPKQRSSGGRGSYNKK